MQAPLFVTSCAFCGYPDEPNEQFRILRRFGTLVPCTNTFHGRTCKSLMATENTKMDRRTQSPLFVTSCVFCGYPDGLNEQFRILTRYGTIVPCTTTFHRQLLSPPSPNHIRCRTPRTDSPPGKEDPTRFSNSSRTDLPSHDSCHQNQFPPQF